jgi:DNA-binding response OmpR family regulator
MDVNLFQGELPMKILLIEDEKLLASSIQKLLTSKGLQVEVVHDGETGAEFAMLGVYDLLILDVMIPGLDGFQVARYVRSHRCNMPILMLTAKSDINSRIEGLNAGADYYLTKPFDTRELLACINALLRRQGSQVDNLVYGNTELDLSTCMLRCGDKQVRLTAKEFDVLRQLLRNGEKLIPKETLLSRVWGYETNAVENHVEVYMAFLRKKLRSIGSNVNIASVRRMGYHLELIEND